MFLNATIAWTGSQPTLYSQTFDCTTLTKLSVIGTITFASGTFTLHLEGSNDNVNFADLGGTHTTLTTATPGIFTVANVAAKYCRAVLTRTSGAVAPTVTTATFNGKY